MKRGVVGLNGRFTPEEVMMMAENNRQALLFLCHGGYRHLRGHPFGLGFIRTLQNPFVQGILKRSLNATTYADESKGTDDAEGERVLADVDPTLEMSGGSAVVSTKTGPITSLGDVNLTPADVRQLLLCCKLGASTVQSVTDKMDQTEVEKLLAGVGATAHRWIEPHYRPPYCRRIEVDRYYTFAVPGPVASARVGYLSDVIGIAGNFYVRVNWVSPSGSADDQTILNIVHRSQDFDVFSASAVLEPHQIVHCCDSACETLGAGFEGKHSAENKYLDNEFLSF
jgi:hypothetical protein